MLTPGNTSFSMFYGIKKENGIEKKKCSLNFTNGFVGQSLFELVFYNIISGLWFIFVEG